MSKLFLCRVCGEHHTSSNVCQIKSHPKASMSGIALAALLGLTACGESEDKDTAATDDTSIEDTDTSDTEDTTVEDTAVDTAVAVMYGVPEDTASWDNDGDGFSVADGDCDDSNPDIHPEAREIAGDGVDSNCNGEDDT